MEILCVVGMPGSGKTVVSDKARQLGIFTLTMDGIIREELQRRGMVYTWSNERKISNWLHDNQRELMRRITNKITEAGKQDKILIEGLKSYKQLESIRKRVPEGKLNLLAVHSPPNLRQKRETQKRNYHIGSHISVDKRDEIEINTGLPSLIAMADHMIINDGDLFEFRQTVKDKLIDVLNIDVKR